MNKGLKIFLIVFLILLGLTSGVLVYTYLHIGQLKEFALKEVNNQLRGELKAKHVAVSVFKTWPRVSLTFQEVSIADPIRPGKSVLVAQNLYLGFDILDVIRENYLIQMIQLDSGTANLYTDAAGRANYDLLKENKKQSGHPLRFELRHLMIKRMQLNYMDQRSQFEISALLEEAEFGGKFSDSLYSMRLTTKSFCQQMKSGKTVLVNNKDIQWKGNIKVDRIRNCYEIENGNLKINRLHLKCQGVLTELKKGTEIDLQFDAQELSIQELLSSLPLNLPEKIYRYRSEGKVYFKGKYAGYFRSGEQPRLTIDFGIDKGRLTEPESGMTMEQIHFKGQFKNGPAKGLSGSTLRITDLSAKLEGSEIKGDLQLNNLEAPLLKLNLIGNIDLPALKTYLKWNDVSTLTGQARFALNLQGTRKGEHWDWSAAANNGSFECEIPLLRLSYLNKDFSEVFIKGKLDRNRLHMESASLNIGNSDFKLAGTCPGFLNFMLNPGTPFTAEMTVSSTRLNTQDIFIYNANDPHEPDELPLKYAIDLKLSVGNFKQDGFEATQVSSSIHLENSRIRFDNTSFNACGGTADIAGEWLEQKEGYALQLNSNLRNIRIQELFRQFDNFGQKELTEKNLNGVLQSKTELRMNFDSKMNAIPSSVLLVSDMSIRNGELLNYEPLNALSKFVDVNELRNLKFSELKNTLTIRNQVITIPAMDIRNNALNLNLAGTHTFSNQVDYQVKLSLSELLKKKRGPRPNQFEEEDEKTNGINLYLSIKGQIGKLSYTFNRREVSQHLKQDIRQEGQNIRELFKQELGIRKDTTLRKLEKKNDNQDELEFEKD